MNRRTSRKRKQQSSVELAMNNGIVNSQSNWSRCNSFSSSSSDSSTLSCSNSTQLSNFSGRKRLKNDELIGKIVKRSRNSSGSSASSNVSCMSDKMMNGMPALMSPEQMSHNIENLADIPQHEALLNGRLSHPLDVNAVLPFRHNLRQNIRRKTCSCDCTATCTTVVVSRQYKEIGEKTVEEKTVISRTKVKTFVESNSVQLPIRQVQMSSKVSFQENMAHGTECSFQENETQKSESNRRRRSEIERLYESLHEIKWAKNFSPDNILRQFDVRQAASCSVFGKTLEEKFTKSDNKANKCSKVSNEAHKNLSGNANKNKLMEDTKLCATRSLRSFESELDSNPPVLEKSIVMTGDKMLDFPDCNAYPVLSKEVLTPDITIFSENNGLSFTSDAMTTYRSFPEKMLSFDVNKQIINIIDCSSTFYDIGDEHTNACFREVGAEVVVSTTCNNEFNSLPLLTAVKEMNASNIRPFLHDSPPKLEQCDSSLDNSVINCNNILGVKSSLPNHPFEHFFPPVKPGFISDEDYSLSLSFIEDYKKNYSVDEENSVFKGKCEEVVEDETIDGSVAQNFCNINDLKTVPHLSSIVPGEEIKNTITKPSVLEPSLSNKVCYVNIKSQISITENITNNDSNKNANNFLSDAIDKANCIMKGTNNFSIKSENTNQVCQFAKNHPKSKSFIITSAIRVLKKYRRFAKSKKRCKLFKMYNKSVKSSVYSMKASAISNDSRDLKIISTNNKSSVIPLSIINFAPSVELVKSPSSSHPQITEAYVNKKCISSISESCLQSSATVVKAKSATVIHNFNQKLSFSTSQDTLNQMKNPCILYQVDKKPCLNSNKKKAKKSSHNNIFNNHHSENFADIPGYSKILVAAKEKEGHTEEKVKVPFRVFTCHFQTINVTRDFDYIQIVLKITRGKSIFLTHETLVELKEAIDKAGSDKDCRLLILNGFGQTFCLGLDVRPLVGDQKNEIVGDIANSVKDLIGTLADFQKPLVAIVNGAAYGLGLTILNHADVTLATNNASFCMPYSRLGYMPEGGATLTLPQAVGTTVAMDLILRGQVITAEQARDIGLINEVVEVRHLPQDLVSRVQTMAQNSLPGMQMTKAMIKMRLHIQLPLVLETEAKLLPQMWLSPSCQEAIQNVLDSGFFEDC